jgi:hypothetical protein
MDKRIIILFLVFAPLFSQTQERPGYYIKNSTLAGSGNELPFWLAANRHGKVDATSTLLNLTGLYAGQEYSVDSSTTFGYTWGGNLVFGFGNNGFYRQVNQAFAGINFKGLELKAGLYYDPVRYDGLSTTNGNLARSYHARPHPKIRLSTQGCRAVSFLPEWFSFKAEYEEGLLNDNRFVKNTRLHHKSLYLKVHPAETWEISGGLEHYVMWGGTSADEQVGSFPVNFKAYLLYIFGLKGNDDFPLNDRMNAAGNQLGTWQLKTVKRFSGVDVVLYVSHYYEDYSGVNWRNWRDNLLGLHIRFKDSDRLLTGFVYEFTNTRNQSVVGKIWQGPDNYFNTGLYESGYTYHRLVMGSPLFFPVVVKDGIARGVRSNRFFAHHVGLRGNISEYLHWKGLLTYIEHWGTYGSPYKPYQKQVSGLLEIQYTRPGFPVEPGLSVAADSGNTINSNFGVQFWIVKKW